MTQSLTLWQKSEKSLPLLHPDLYETLECKVEKQKEIHDRKVDLRENRSDTVL